MLSLSLAGWDFYFQNCLSSFLVWANCMATNTPPPKPHPKKKKPFLPLSSGKRKRPHP